MRIGICARAEASSPDAETASSCTRGMTHSLSADRKITAQNPFGLRDELVDRGAYPPPLPLHLEQLQSVLDSGGKALKQCWACAMFSCPSISAGLSPQSRTTNTSATEPGVS